MTDYTEIPALSDFVLEESYVLEVVERSDVVELRIDLMLAKTHPDLRAPREGQSHDFSEGVIRFEGVTVFEWTDKHPPAHEPDGTTSWDGIDSFTQDGSEFRLSGDVGSMRIVADRVECELNGES